MKKIFVMVSFALAALTFSSCGSDDTMSKIVNQEQTQPVSPVDAANIESIKAQIQILNSHVYGEKFQTRSFFTFMKKFIKVVVADVKGAAEAIKNSGSTTNPTLGYVISNAATASIDAATETFVSNGTGGVAVASGQTSIMRFSNGSIPQVDKIVLTKGSKNPIVDSIGVYHNAVVGGVIKSNTDAVNLYKCDARVFANTVASSTENCLKLATGTLTANTQAMNLLVDGITTFRTTGLNQTADDMIAEMAKTTPKEAELMGVVLEYLNGVVSADDTADARNYSAQVLDIINKSNLDESSKDMLRVGISVGFASSNLWNVDAFVAR